MYGSNLFSSSYQLLTSITSLGQTVTAGTNMIAINTTIDSQKIAGFNITFSSPLIGFISTLKLSYLTMDSQIRNLQVYLLDNYLGASQLSTLAANSSSSVYLFNFTEKISRGLTGYTNYTIEPFIKGYQITNNNCRQFSLGVTGAVQNSSFYSITVSSKALTDQLVSNVYVTVMAFNFTVLQSQNTLYEQFSVNFSQSTASYSNFGAYHINLTNFFVGVQQFTYSGPTDSFQFDIENDFTLQQSSLLNMSPQMISLGVLMIKVQIRSCNNASYPYFLNVDGVGNLRCYITCPLRYWQNDILMKCQNCPFDCYECVNSLSCTKCNSTTYFREDNIVNGILRCKPLSGYFNNKNNDAVASKCDSTKCVECWLYNDNCTKCKSDEYLQVVSYNGSCHECMNNCLQCDDNLTCNQCAKLFVVDSNRQCAAVCNQYCSQCHIQITPIYKQVCDVCLLGYHLNISQAPQCYTICGDGYFISLFQGCDDNNTINGDGCSSQCKTQLGYNCYLDNNNLSLPQLCYYQQEIRFSLHEILKLQYKNAFTFNLTIETLNNNVLKELSYSNIISINLEYQDFFVVRELIVYKDSLYMTDIDYAIVTFQVQYNQFISNTNNLIEVILNPKRNYQNSALSSSSKLSTLTTLRKETHHNHSTRTQLHQTSSLVATSTSSNSLIKFSTTPITKQTYTIKSDNNLAIIYQENSFFSLSNILEYIFLTIGVLALFMLLFSFTVYGGKIIVLEYLFLCNCAYFSLIGFKNIQVFSTLRAISGLRMVSLNIYPITYTTTNPLWWAGLSQAFINNCIIPISLLFLPIIIFLVAIIVSKKTTNIQTYKATQFLQKYSLGQLSMTFYLITAYTLTVNFVLSISKLATGSPHSDIAGIAVGGALLIMGVVLFIMLIKKRELFWQFISTFYKSSIPEYYMNFTTLIVWINSIFLVAMSTISYGNVIPILMSILWIGFLVKFTPYRNIGQKRRPVIIQVSNILVQSLFLTLKIMLSFNEEKHQLLTIFHYFPLIISIILLLSFLYSAYCLFHKIKQGYIDRKDFLENEKLVKNNLAIIKQSSQTNSDNLHEKLSIQKKIFEEIKKEKGMNFLSLALSIDKKDLDNNWDKLESINTKQSDGGKSDKMKRNEMKKLIDRSLMRQGVFGEANQKIREYFEIHVDKDNEDQFHVIKTPQNNSNKKQVPTHSQCKDSIEQVQCCANCGQKRSFYSQHENQFSQYKYKYESQKYKQEWKEFFKPKEEISNEKKHSLAEYDMI